MKFEKVLVRLIWKTKRARIPICVSAPGSEPPLTAYWGEVWSGMAEMVVATKAEDGAKNFEWHRNGNAVHIYERYETNGDAGIHLGNLGENFAERFLAILTPTGLEVYGPAEGGVREGLAGFGAVFYDQVGGFVR
jgi:hypothetical protein